MVDSGIIGQPSNTSLGLGLNQNMRLGRLAELIVQELHGRYYETAYNKAMFSVANQAVATTTVGLATTYTGLVLSNPINSPVNLVLNKCTMFQSVIQAVQVEAFGIAFGYNQGTNVTHTTPQAPQSTFIGGTTTANAKADVSATLPTAPVYGAFVANTGTATADATQGIIDFEGSIILPPGAYAAWVTPAQASVAGMWFSFSWEEVPV